VPVVISTIHSIQDGGRLRLLGYRLTDRLADLTTIVSEAAAERYVAVGAVPRSRLRVIPNAVDAERFRPDPAERERLRRELGLGNDFTWLAVGRFELAKDYPTMLAAFAQVQRTRPDARLVLVGAGSRLGEVEALARSLGLGGRLSFLGIRRDVPGLMSAADGYVLSSAWEGMPTVLLEAAATALPVVATAVGGNREVVADGSTGILVRPRSPEALSAGMLRLMEASMEERAAMGSRGRDAVLGRYTLSRIVDRWEETYRELLDRKRARRDLRAGQGVGTLHGGQR
jgi:glycosyltransferase involved in cell wall biosynthesis